MKERSGRGENVELGALGREVGLSKWHLLRCFKRRVGVSPREMGEGLRREMEGAGDGVKTPGLSEGVGETPGSRGIGGLLRRWVWSGLRRSWWRGVGGRM